MDSKHEDNPFQKLPDALLLLIFDKILDLEPKTLASCFLVSKHFASLISQTYTNTNTVFLPMETEPPAIPQSKKPSRRLFQNRFTNFLSKLSRKPKPARVSFSSSSLDQVLQKEIRASDVLKIFREIKCLKIQSHSAGRDHPFTSGFLMWKAFFGAELCDGLFLFAESFHKINDPIENTSRIDRFYGSKEERSFLLTFNCFYIEEAFQRHRYVIDIISDNRCMLKRVVVCDSKNRGKVCMREEDIEECRNKRLDKDTNTELFCSGTMWRVPVLDLPVHGYTMKRAVLCWFCPTGLPKGKEEDVLKGFEDDEEEERRIFNEGVREIVFNNNINKRTSVLNLNFTV